MRYLPIILFLLTSPAFADNGPDCSSIKDRNDRLACFDRLFPIAPETPKQQAPSTDGPQPTQTAAPATPAQLPATPEKPPISSSEGVPVTAQSPNAPAITETPAVAKTDKTKKLSFTKNILRKTKRMFDRETVEVTATIKEVIDRDRKKMVFLLDNDQIWLQASPRNLPIRQNDRVTIKSGFIGGYILRNEKGTSTRVERIR
jgi:hypothetical protein